jgi:hypothetical protein
MKTPMFLSLGLFMLLGMPEQSLAESVIAQIADGKPWALTTADGRNAQVTYLPGGKGILKVGGRSLNVKWREKNGHFCLKPGPMRERCVEMRAVKDGFDGYLDGKQESSLRR